MKTKSIKSIVNFGALLDKYVPKFFGSCYADITREELYNIAFRLLSELWLEDFEMGLRPTRANVNNRFAAVARIIVCLLGIYTFLPPRYKYRPSVIISGIYRMLTRIPEIEAKYPWLDRWGEIGKAHERVRMYNERRQQKKEDE